MESDLSQMKARVFPFNALYLRSYTRGHGHVRTREILSFYMMWPLMGAAHLLQSIHRGEYVQAWADKMDAWMDATGTRSTARARHSLLAGAGCRRVGSAESHCRRAWWKTLVSSEIGARCGDENEISGTGSSFLQRLRWDD